MECNLRDVTIYFEEYGLGLPILMIHGFTPDHRLMKGCMEPLFKVKDHYKRIYFDLPGMGKTSGPKWLKNSDQMLNVILKFIDKIIPNNRFIIASESYGCYLARGLIHKRSEFIDGALFICPLIVPQSNKRDLPKDSYILKRDNKLISSLSQLEVEELENSLVVQSLKIWERYKDEVQSGLKIADQVFLNTLFEKGYPFSFNIDEIMGKFDKPTLFLLGRQDITVGYRDAWSIIESYPRATFAILDQAGHNLQIEQERLFNSLVLNWLERIELNISTHDKS
ncbi:MAG: alpha/beta fold hydrolase [Candidatus Thorarchaeota archaeon]